MVCPYSQDNPLTKSLPKISFLLTKDSVLAANQRDTEDTYFVLIVLFKKALNS